MAKPITLSLTADQALVLSDWLWRYEQTGQLAVEHAAEYLVLLGLSALLDKTLVELFAPDYNNRVASARDRIAEGFDGEVPGLKEPKGE